MFGSNELPALPVVQMPKVTEVLDRLRAEAERRAVREAIAEAEATQLEARLRRRRSDHRID